MSANSASEPAFTEGASVVITHRVRDNKQADYEKWLDEIAPLSKAAEGHLDWHIVRPIPGLTATYTIIIRFDTNAHLRAWMNSAARARLIRKVRPLLVTDDDFFVSSGLDFWFAPAGAKARIPVRWKQCLATWVVIYPLVLGTPLAVTPLLQLVGFPVNRYLTTFAVTGIVVFLMVYVVMPHFTRLIQRWLFS
jgi:antibiotic biosynthesis monooxygenase (ABM) superfamily enzyme